MKHTFLAASALIPLLAFTPAPAKASVDVDLLSIALGIFDANDDDGAADFRLEYRFARPLIWDISPWLGLEVTSDGGLYGAGGLLYDWEFTEDWHFTPSFGIGLFSDGGGKDLGGTVEFRSQLELGYEFENGYRLSVAGSHISNAGLDDRNPGTEVVSFYLHIPFDDLF